MADNKKFLDLNGLGFFLRKIDAKKANLESPAFTGTPTAPTADAGTNTTQIATTAFIIQEMKNDLSEVAFSGNIEDLTQTEDNYIIFDCGNSEKNI